MLYLQVLLFLKHKGSFHLPYAEVQFRVDRIYSSQPGRVNQRLQGLINKIMLAERCMAEPEALLALAGQPHSERQGPLVMESTPGLKQPHCSSFFPYALAWSVVPCRKASEIRAFILTVVDMYIYPIRHASGVQIHGF